MLFSSGFLYIYKIILMNAEVAAYTFKFENYMSIEKQH